MYEDLYKRVKANQDFKPFIFSLKDERGKFKDLDYRGCFLACGETKKEDVFFTEAIVLLDDRRYLYLFVESETHQGICEYYLFFDELLDDGKASPECLKAAHQFIEAYSK